MMAVVISRTLGAEWLQGLGQEGFDHMVDTEALQHREHHGEKRHQRQQRRIDQTGRPRIEQPMAKLHADRSGQPKRLSAHPPEP